MYFTLDDLRTAWQSFFHSTSPASSIGAFRIVWGVLLGANGLLLAPHANRFFGPDGVLPTQRYRAAYGKSRFSLFHVLPDSNAAVRAVLLIHIGSALSLAAGWFTPLSAALSFISLVSLHHRNPAVFHSGDSLMRLLTFLLIFSRAGDCYSVDAALALEPPARSSPWCERLMQLQVSILYLRTVHWKLRGKLWPQGLAAYYPTQVKNFQRLRVPACLCNLPFIRLATWGTLLVESGVGVLIWFDEFRYPAIIVGILLHLIFELFLNLQLFGAVMISSYLLFVDPGDMQRFAEWTWRAVVGDSG